MARDNSGRWALLGIVLPGIIVSTLFWRSYLNFTPSARNDFESVTGILASTSERNAGRFRDFRLENDPLLYRIPIDGYREGFDRNSFQREYSAGILIKFLVPKGGPKHPPLAKEPIYFVRSVIVNDREYLSFESLIDWEIKDNRAFLHLAIAASGITALFVGFGIVHARKL